MGLGWGWVGGGSWSAPGQTTVIQIKRTIDHMYMINQKGGGGVLIIPWTPPPFLGKIVWIFAACMD